MRQDLKLLPVSLMAAFLLLLLFFICASLSKIPVLGSLFTLLVIIYQLSIPFEILKYFKLSPQSFNIYAHHIESFFDGFLPPFKMGHPDYPGILKELKSLALTSILLFVPYVAGYWLFFKWRAIDSGLELIWSFNLPPKLALEIVMQIFLVALPEELFFRGFLQGALVKHGLNMWLSAILTNIIFAVGHLANSFSPSRLLTFFPGLIFSYLINKNKSLLSPILFHAACNILGQILYFSIFLR